MRFYYTVFAALFIGINGEFILKQHIEHRDLSLLRIMDWRVIIISALFCVAGASLTRRILSTRRDADKKMRQNRAFDRENTRIPLAAWYIYIAILWIIVNLIPAFMKTDYKQMDTFVNGLNGWWLAISGIICLIIMVVLRVSRTGSGR